MQTSAGVIPPLQPVTLNYSPLMCFGEWFPPVIELHEYFIAIFVLIADYTYSLGLFASSFFLIVF